MAEMVKKDGSTVIGYIYAQDGLDAKMSLEKNMPGTKIKSCVPLAGKFAYASEIMKGRLRGNPMREQLRVGG